MFSFYIIYHIYIYIIYHISYITYIYIFKQYTLTLNCRTHPSHPSLNGVFGQSAVLSARYALKFNIYRQPWSPQNMSGFPPVPEKTTGKTWPYHLKIPRNPAVDHHFQTHLWTHGRFHQTMDWWFEQFKATHHGWSRIRKIAIFIKPLPVTTWSFHPWNLYQLSIVPHLVSKGVRKWQINPHNFATYIKY